MSLRGVRQAIWGIESRGRTARGPPKPAGSTMIKVGREAPSVKTCMVERGGEHKVREVDLSV